MSLRVLVDAILVLAAASYAVFGAAPPAWAQLSDSEEAGVHRSAVEALEAAGIRRGTGCTFARLCPQEPLPRWAMAVWLVRALDGRDPPRSDGSRFADVASWQWWAPHVERLADLGITRGCKNGPARFCPD